MGLNDSFAQLRTQLLLMESKPQSTKLLHLFLKKLSNALFLLELLCLKIIQRFSFEVIIHLHRPTNLPYFRIILDKINVMIAQFAPIVIYRVTRLRSVTSYTIIHRVIVNAAINVLILLQPHLLNQQNPLFLQWLSSNSIDPLSLTSNEQCQSPLAILQNHLSKATSTESSSHVADICFNQHITFYNVLYIPSFAFNLISISAMTGQLLIEIRFDRDFCAF